MPNIKSQIKRDLTAKKQNAANSARRSEYRTAVKKVELLAKEGKKEEAVVALRNAISLLDKAAQDGLLKKNSANRKKASLEKIVAAI